MELKAGLLFLSILSITISLKFREVSSDLAQLTSGLYSHLQIKIISNLIQKENVIPLTGLHSISMIDSLTNLSSANSSLPFLRKRSLKMLVNMNSSADTLRVLSEIGSAPDVRNHQFRPYVFVIWPESVVSENIAKSILDSEAMKEACKGFTIASHLILIFIKSSLELSKSELSDKEQVKEENYILYEAYNINEYHIVDKLDYGVPDFRCVNCRGRAIRRSNFYGLTLNIVGNEDKDRNDDLHFDQLPNGELVFSDDGFSAKILQILQTSLNFTIKAIKTDDWGRYIPENDSWVGAVKMVMDGKADLGIAIALMLPDRASVISFLPAADEHVITGFFRTPEQNAIRDIFASPFKPDLWAAVFSTWVVLAFFMILFSVIRKRYDLQIGKDGVEEPDFTQDSFIWALATACQQGWDEHPVAGSLRTIFISGSFTGVVAYAGYSAAIVSTLSLRIDPIQTPEQLLKSKLNIGIRQGFLTSELLKQNNTNDIMTGFQKKLLETSKEKQYMSIADGYQNLLTHPFAFISTRDNFYDNLKMSTGDTEICALKELRILKHGFPIGHFVKKYSPYKEFFRYIYVTIREPGVSSKLRSNYTYRRKCLEATDSSGQALGGNDVFTAFMILVGGYLFSVSFLIAEKLLRVSTTFSYIR